MPFTTVFMLAIFWLTARGSDDAGVMVMMFPVIVSFGVMLGESNTAVRAVNWRQQKLFQRLAVTPVPVGQLMLGDAAAVCRLGAAEGIAEDGGSARVYGRFQPDHLSQIPLGVIIHWKAHSEMKLV